MALVEVYEYGTTHHDMVIGGNIVPYVFREEAEAAGHPTEELRPYIGATAMQAATHEHVSHEITDQNLSKEE